MGSSPRRRIQLLGIAHPFVEITILGTKGTWGWDASEALEAKKWPDFALFLYFVEIWVEDPVFIVTCK